MNRINTNHRNNIFRMFNLRNDLDSPENIDENIRDGVEIFGTNLWVLMFAILVASVGLNVNSAPVIIGAMLISPLMGPIIGMGYGLAIHDMALIRKALKSFLIFTAISLVTSTVYFYISPLKETGSELLARTSPTLWDVLIAFFGGSAGIIAITRRSISNVVPGMAIATALMPPLCTAGYSLAHGHWEWMGGALYLYTLNTVFIAYATLVFIKLMRLNTGIKLHAFTRAKTRLITGLTLIAMIAPSIYLGWRVVQTQNYNAALRQIIDSEALQNKVVVLRQDINTETKQVSLTIAGNLPTEVLREDIITQIKQQGLPETHISIQSVSGNSLDVANIRRELQQDILRTGDIQRSELQNELTKLQSEKNAQDTLNASLNRVKDEIKVQYPSVHSVVIGWTLNTASPAPASAASATDSGHTILVHVFETSPLAEQEKTQLQNWLNVRLAPHPVLIAYTPFKAANN